MPLVPVDWKLYGREHRIPLLDMTQIMIFMPAFWLCLLRICRSIEAANEDETRPYEFSFNIADFQHRIEKKDSEGIVTGEYGFITADGVYHETGYATNKNGQFLITKMRNRKITSLRVAEEIFKDKPEVAKRIIQVLARSCGGCGIPVHKRNEDNASDKLRHEVKTSEGNISSATLNTKVGAAVTEAMDVLSRDAVAMKNGNFAAVPGRETIPRERTGKEEVNNEISDDEIRKAETSQAKNGGLETMEDDFHYRYNYTITSHGHEETGYRDGKKDGSYRARGVNGTDTKVEYVSNEFGHQPNITFVDRLDAHEGKEKLRGFSFEWIFRKR